MQIIFSADMILAILFRTINLYSPILGDLGTTKVPNIFIYIYLYFLYIYIYIYIYIYMCVCVCVCVCVCDFHSLESIVGD